MKSLTYIEIDIDHCALAYGNSPCTAAIGVTGELKCFNSRATCQDIANFDNEPLALRFAVPSDYLPKEIEAIPSIKEVDFTPAVISLGVNLGQRATLTVTFEDHPHADTGVGFDKYVTERHYDPSRRGTFWGKFRARQPYLLGRSLRIIRGIVGQTLLEMETRHYVIESFDGPTPDGEYRIVAQDVLKLADGDRARAPRLSNGFLFEEITEADTSAQLSPVGVGDAEYPASGYVAIGGREICAFTRSGDVLTLTRAQLGTEAAQHDDGDRVQLVLRYVGQSPAIIIEDLLTDYAEINPSFIPLSSWSSEVSAYLQRVYTATIAEPTPVRDLVSELIEQSALALWWNDVDQLIGLRVLRSIDTTAEQFTEAQIIEDSFAVREQPTTRISQVWTYFGQRNPLESQTDPNNYRSVDRKVDEDAEAAYGAPAIKIVYSRWIPAFARTTARRLNDILLGRFRDPPRRFNFDIFRTSYSVSVTTNPVILARLKELEEAAENAWNNGDFEAFIANLLQYLALLHSLNISSTDPNPSLAHGYNLLARSMQDATGTSVPVPIQVTRVAAEADRIRVEAQEARFKFFDIDDLANRVIVIDGHTFGFNLRTVHDSIFPRLSNGVGITLTCIIEPGVIVGGVLHNTNVPAFDISGGWPSDLTINLIIRGRIQGAGGGRASDPNNQGGAPGGKALRTTRPINVELHSTGEVWGGGGQGGYGRANAGSRPDSGGGGGTGSPPGAGGKGDVPEHDGFPGTTEEGGIGGSAGASSGRGGNGGGPGLPGQNGFGSSGPQSAGGAAGAAIDGLSLVTFTVNDGDRRGPEIN